MKRIRSTIVIATMLLFNTTHLCCAASKAAKIQVANEMIEKEPEKHSVRIVVGFLYFDGGDFQDAEKHFKKASELTPADPYDQAWLYMAQLRKNPNASGKALKSFVEKNQSTEFIYTNIKLLLGEISPEDAIKQAIASKDQGNICEAYYYAAQRFLSDGQQKMAEKCFKKSIATGKDTFWEFKSSVAGLESLQ